MAKIGLGANISSLAAQRGLNSATSALTKTFERLSSGQRINRASDDAAGLAIAASLNATGRVYTQAMRNVNDGVSELSIAEGAMQQLTSILQRQKELATEAANGTYGTKQRASLQAEANQLTGEFNRIVATTVFNGTAILDGSSQQLVFQVGANGTAASSISVDISGLLTSTSSSSAGGSITTAASGTAEQDSVNFANSLIHANFSFDFLDATSHVNTDGFRFSTYVGGVQQDYYVWFDMDGNAVDPGGPGTGFKIDIPSNLHASDIADLVASTLSGVAGTTISAVGSRLTISNSEAGTLNVDNTNTSGSFDIWVTAGGTTGISMQPGSYVNFSTPTNDYYVWFSYGGVADPAIAGRTGIRVNYNPTQDSATLLANTAATINSAGTGLIVGTAGNTLTLTNSANGAVTAPSSSTGILSVARPVVGTATAIAPTTDTVAIAAHGYSTGQQVLLSSTGSLPTGLSAGTYYVIAVNSNTIKLASSLANASGGTAIDITGYGTGTMTLTPQSAGSTTTMTPYISNIDISTQSVARSSLDTVDTQMQRVATTLGSIGAAQSRLSSVLSALGVARENNNAAASRIMSADIASESANLVRQQILQQAASSVLAQANQAPSLVLRLLGS